MLFAICYALWALASCIRYSTWVPLGLFALMKFTLQTRFGYRPTTTIRGWGGTWQTKTKNKGKKNQPITSNKLLGKKTRMGTTALQHQFAAIFLGGEMSLVMNIFTIYYCYKIGKDTLYV